jgi:glycosyltransferase involved in cell wall biosynthesis
MACGVPVIASDSGSLPEVVAADGLLFREGDAKDLLEQIRGLRNENVRSEYRARGLSRVQSLYTWDRVADAMYTFYERALELAAQPIKA